MTLVQLETMPAPCLESIVWMRAYQVVRETSLKAPKNWGFKQLLEDVQIRNVGYVRF